jgi:peptidoglycan L-alanyl-D-glutamate endopeptidase CwlK
LQVICDELLNYVDISLTSGYRDREEQNALYENRKSKVRFPDSKHNRKPSQAVDLQPHPYPSNENDLRAALGYIAGLAMLIAEKHGWQLRWGGDWNRNGSVVDNGFDDLFHLELYNEPD